MSGVQERVAPDRRRWVQGLLGLYLVCMLAQWYAGGTAEVPVTVVRGERPAAAPLDVNREPGAPLTLLDGVGPRLAERIVEARERRGPFRSTADLAARVRGISLRRAAALAGRISFDGVMQLPEGLTTGARQGATSGGNR